MLATPVQLSFVLFSALALGWMGWIRGVYGPLWLTAIPALCVVLKDDREIPIEGVLKAITFGDSQCRSEE